MFGIFKKEELVSEVVAVSDLKDHIVKGYDKERELIAEIEQLENKLQINKEKQNENKKELDAFKVIVDEKSKRVDELESQLRRLESDSKFKITQLTTKNESLQDKLNDYEIQLKDLTTGEARITVSQSIKDTNRALERFRINLTNEIKNTKGNLSKEMVINMVNERTLRDEPKL